MRVLVNAVAAKMGGALGHLRTLVQELEARRSPHEWTFLIDASVVDLPSRTVRVEAVETGGTAARAAADQVLVPLWARRGRADVLVSLLNHGPRVAGVPHIVFQRNAWYFDGAAGGGAGIRARRALALAACRGASAVVTPTHAMARSVVSALGPEPPVVVIPHGIDTAYFAPGLSDGRELVDRALAGTGRPRLVYVALASPHKGHDELLAAVRVVAASFPDTTLALTIGPDEPPHGGDRERAQRLIAEAADMPAVRFVGRCGRAGVRALYDWADIAVFPSRLESFGFPLVEAMAMGLPVVASDMSVSRELAGDAALFHPVGDGAGLATQVLRLAADPDQRAALAAEGRRRAADFSMRQSVTRIETLLEAVAAGQPITHLAVPS